LELAKELWNLLKKNMLKNFGSCSRTLELAKEEHAREFWILLKNFGTAKELWNMLKNFGTYLRSSEVQIYLVLET
jgi:hypothetical protein